MAKIYQEEIEKRSNYFTHLVFPIISTTTKEHKNFGIFKACLDQLPLTGSLPHEDSAIIPQKNDIFRP